MIRAVYRKPKTNELINDVSADLWPQLLQEAHGLLWIDLEEESPEQILPILRDLFQFHPLVIEDALEDSHTPALTEWDDYIFLTLCAAHYHESGPTPLDIQDISCFLGKNYLLTIHHKGGISAIARVWERGKHDLRTWKGGPDHLLYLLIDSVLQDQAHNVAHLERHLEKIEDSLFDNPQRPELEYLFSLKQSLLALRHITVPQRDIIGRLTRDQTPFIDQRDRIFFRDLYEQFIKLANEIEYAHNLVGSALDTYWTVVNTNMNNTIKLLTVLTVLFMPLTFITGFFGMNFFQADKATPLWTHHLTLELAVILMGFIPLLMLWWMRRRHII